MDGAGGAAAAAPGGAAPAAPAVRGLNESQAEAVLADPAQPLCIFAGAGSGKTLTLCRRMAYALSMGEDPAAILCLTFSRHAAEELRSRVGEMSSSHAARSATVSTFHAFCLRVLRRHLPRYQTFGYGEGFTIVTREEQHEILRGCLQLFVEQTEEGAAEREELARRGEAAVTAAVKGLAKAVERHKTSGAQDCSEPRLAFVLHHYGECMRGGNMLDFADLLLLAVRLFEQCDGVAASYREQYSSVFIDEFQDTTRLQLELVRLLGCPRLTVVGTQHRPFPPAHLGRQDSLAMRLCGRR